MSFENTWALWLLCLLAPLVALFLLPLRKKRIVVASMILWEKVFEAKNVKNVSRWMRVLATIVLEAVILTAVVLAAGRLYFSGSSSQYAQARAGHRPLGQHGRRLRQGHQVRPGKADSPRPGRLQGQERADDAPGLAQ